MPLPQQRTSFVDTPEFFDRAPRLQLRDPLAEFLGAAREGLIEYTYADSVKLAGRFARRGLLAFGVPMQGLVRFTRTDTGAGGETVEILRASG